MTPEMTNPNASVHTSLTCLTPTKTLLPARTSLGGEITAVTAMLRSGVSVKAASERVGHASTSFTQDVYTTVLPDMQREAADRMAAALDGPE